jgi:DNA topoisomerase VI subunit B
MNAPVKLRRQTFKTSRLLEFCSERELTNVCGHPVTDWPLVVLKEMTDNALDATEEAGVAPVINITVDASSITIADNGPGLPAKTVKDILDYRVRMSSREAYCSPSQGQQGNALSSIIPMPFVVDGDRGETTIAARGVVHKIAFRVDRLRQEPKIDHLVENCPGAKNGTKITVHWPDAAGYPDGLLSKAKPRFLQIAADTTWLNPHLSLTVDWNGKRELDIAAAEPEWRKWGPSDPTSAHWYDIARLERYIAAHVARDQDRGRDRTVREFIAEFRGLSASAKQKVILDDIGAARMSLSEFFSKEGQPDRKRIGRLLDALKKHTKPVKPGDLGIIGKDYLLQRAVAVGGAADSFQYQKSSGETANGLPFVVETAFAWCPDGTEEIPGAIVKPRWWNRDGQIVSGAAAGRRIIVGANWSVSVGTNPFRSFGAEGEGLETILSNQRAGHAEPIIFLLHLACPRLNFLDRGKSSISLDERED